MALYSVFFLSLCFQLRFLFFISTFVRAIITTYLHIDRWNGALCAIAKNYIDQMCISIENMRNIAIDGAFFLFQQQYSFAFYLSFTLFFVVVAAPLVWVKVVLLLIFIMANKKTLK